MHLMNAGEFRDYCLSKKGTSESFPFDTVTMVIKVGSKMFTCFDINDQPLRVNLKCDPDLAPALRDRYGAVIPGYHMNKRHWNTVILDGSIPEDEVRLMIDDSYDLVFRGLPKAERDRIEKG